MEFAPGRGPDLSVPVDATPEPQFYPLKDSGDRRQFGTGAVRDRAEGKGRFDLLPVFGLTEVAKHMEAGARKYSDRNWEAGMPLSVYWDSAMRHMVKAIGGFSEEPHMEAAAWNLLCFLETRERIKRGLLPGNLDDMPRTYEGHEPNF